MDYIFHKAARDEFLQSVAFYESKVPGLGDRFVTEINRCIELLLETPLAGTPIGKRLRIYAVDDSFPFSIIYAISTNAILVVAVAHQSRRPGYWSKRVPIRSR